MKIGILGTGDVGSALAKGFAALGNRVMIGSRDPDQDKVKAIIREIGGDASTGTLPDAAKFCEIAVLATSWSGTENAIKMADPVNLSGKTVIDVTNPLDFSGGQPRLALGNTDSGGEQVQRWLPSSNVVKAFNIIGNAHMFMPIFLDGSPDMFICGNDGQSKSDVTKILHDFGWDSVIDIGDIKGSRLLEPLAMLWITYGARTNSWGHAFKLLYKK
jgi:predicted dinucleotide-binding enzyme